MWSWLLDLLNGRRTRAEKPLDSQPPGEFGDGLSEAARAEIDRLREDRGWGVRSASNPVRKLRSVVQPGPFRSFDVQEILNGERSRPVNREEQELIDISTAKAIEISRKSKSKKSKPGQGSK